MRNKISRHSKLALESHLSSIRAFTLIELLVVVMIIAVLTAVAMPMYKHAVLKSRFSTVMPMAKAVAEAQEVYYLGKNMYALSTDELDVVPTQGTGITLAPSSQEDEYNYVAAYSNDVPGARYIMYQKNSPQFANTIQCEANENVPEALWLCEKGLNGTELPGSVNTAAGEYKTFLLAGTAGSKDKLPTSITKLAASLCEGKEGCTYTLSDSNNDGIDDTIKTKQCGTKNITYTYDANGFQEQNATGCVEITYDEGGNPTGERAEICPTSGRLKDDICKPISAGTFYEYIYENGKNIERKECSVGTPGAVFVCEGIRTYIDDRNNRLKTENRVCANSTAINLSGICPAGYDSIEERTFLDNTTMYPAETNKCNVSTLTTSGECTEYSSMEKTNWTSDRSGRVTLACTDIDKFTCKDWETYYTSCPNGYNSTTQTCNE